jgi:hypothetical protein
MAETTLERLDEVIGDGREDSKCRCDGTMPSVLLLDAIPFMRIWFRDRPMNRIDEAVVLVTNPGSRCCLITNSYKLSVYFSFVPLLAVS